MLISKFFSFYDLQHGNQAAGDHEKGQRSAGLTVLKKIYIEQESQDTASQLADNVYHSRR